METAATTMPEWERGLMLSWEEFDRRMKENREEFEKNMMKSREEYEKQRKEDNKKYDKLLGKIGGRIGAFLEEMVEPNLLPKFQAMGLKVERSSRNIEFYSEDGRKLAEVDILLEDGDKVLVVEVKSKPSNNDIRDFIERMEIVRTCADAKNDKRRYLGAFGGMVFDDGVKSKVLRQGFYVIAPSGNTFDIIPPEGKPREW